MWLCPRLVGEKRLFNTQGQGLSKDFKKLSFGSICYGFGGLYLKYPSKERERGIASQLIQRTPNFKNDNIL